MLESIKNLFLLSFYYSTILTWSSATVEIPRKSLDGNTDEKSIKFGQSIAPLDLILVILNGIFPNFCMILLF